MRRAARDGVGGTVGPVDVDAKLDVLGVVGMEGEEGEDLNAHRPTFLWHNVQYSNAESRSFWLSRLCKPSGAIDEKRRAEGLGVIGVDGTSVVKVPLVRLGVLGVEGTMGAMEPARLVDGVSGLEELEAEGGGGGSVQPKSAAKAVACDGSDGGSQVD